MYAPRASRRHSAAPLLGAVACLVAAAAPAAAQNFNIKARGSLSDLQAGVARDTNDPVAYYDLALGYWSKKKYDQADSVLRRAIALDPELAAAHLALALVELPNKSHWENLKRAHGDTAVVQELRFRRREYARAFMIDPFLDVQPLGMFERGYEQGFQDLERTRVYFRDHLGRMGDSLPPGLLWLHSLAAVHTNRLPAAITDVESLARIAAHYEQTDSLGTAPLVANNYLFMLAALFQRVGDRIDAIHFYQAVLNNDIGNYEAHVQLARIYESDADWGHALEERRAAVAVFPENPRLILDLGVTEYRAGILSDAEQTLHEAQAAGPRDPDAWYWLGTVQRARGDTSSARHDYGEYLRLAPGRDSVQVAAARRALDSLP